MVQEVLPNLYTIEVPLTGNPLKATNCYVIKADQKALIVDTGMNREECLNAISAGLEQLEVDLAETDFVITHLHADHSGLVGVLANKNATIYMGERDSRAITQTGRNYFEEVFGVAIMHGFPEEELREALGRHPGARHMSRSSDLTAQIIGDGDRIAIGDYSFECIETPGHTEGHICLYDASKKLFISGDHVLIDITPNISHWSVDDLGNPLRNYLDSLDKIRNLDVDLVLPGHRRRFKDLTQRVDELKQHHDRRANEVLSILKQDIHNTYQVASQMSWDLTYKKWEQFPAPQKWFAAGEAHAHIRYLEGERKVIRHINDQQITFGVSG